ncbi:hypothetical protein ACKAV7_014329 [Fusarium commune]
MTLVKAQPPFNNGHVKNEAKAWAQNKLSQMTLEEKVLLLTGEDVGFILYIPRTPLGGRNFEAYSEASYLTGKIAGEFLNRLQDAGNGACIKHLAANDQETRRFFIDKKIPDRALREIALQLFQIAIRDIEWGWDGLVMSDWFGTKIVVPSVKAGYEATIEKRLKDDWHETGLILRCQALCDEEEKADNLPEHRATFRRAGAEAHLAPHYHTTPYEWIKPEIAAKLPTAKVQAHAGILTHRYSLFVDPAVMTNPGTGNSGFQLSLFRNMNHCDQPFMVEHRLSSNLVYYDGLPPELTASERYSYRGRAILKPKTTGLHEFSLFLSELEREEVQDSGRIGFMENPGVLDKFFQDDTDMARGSDIAIIIVGKDHEWETETSDMVSMDLPGRSNEFISAVAVPRSTGFSWELSMNRVYD